MLTSNEKKVLRMIMAAFDTDYSINQVAKECNLAPNGALKILKKFEKEQIVFVKKIANIKSYKLNFNEKAISILELALMPELAGRIKHRADDLKELKEASRLCIIFGSYIDMNKNPNDMDVLFVIDDYKKYKNKLEKIRDIVPVKIHDIIQTEDDLKSNLIKKDKIVLEAIKKGVVLWGYDYLVKVIKDAY
jgi:DNA-binding Lrp family transcriptional regulator